MRFERLDLQAFGHFTDRAIDFGDGTVDFHMLLGRNEAGKSTTLAAITDLLFGIERLSRYRFLHDNALMLGASVAGETGDRLTFKRRKGDKNTLLDENGEVLGESRLAALRGSDDRAFFTGMFGLDHERLRRGGEEMYSAKGDLGRSLLQAGAAVQGLHALMNRLESDAGQLFSPLGRNPRINAGLSEYREIRQSVAKAALKGDVWRQHREAGAAVDERIAALGSERDRLMAERSRIERIHRILPLVARLREVQRALAGLEGAPDLPANSAERRLAAQEARRAARQALDSHQEELSRLDDEHEALPLDGALLTREQAIETLRARHGEIFKDLADLPLRRAELAQIAAQIAATLRELDADLPPERAEERILPRPKAAEVRALITQGAEGQADQRQTAHALEEARLRLRQLESEIATLPDHADPAPLKEALRDIMQSGSPPVKLEETRRNLAESDRALASLLARVPFWTEGPARLAATVLPDPERQRHCQDRIAAEQQRMERLDQDLLQLTQDRDRADAEIAVLTRAGPVATEAALTDARRRRDEHWRAIRRHFADGDRAGPPSPDLADAFEDALGLADSLADRVKGEAQRAARLEEAERARLLAGQRMAALANQRAQAALALAEAEATWAGFCTGSGLPLLSFEQMQALGTLRQQVSDLIHQRNAIEAQAALWEERLGSASARLSGLIGVAPDTPFAQLFDRAEAQLEEAEHVGSMRRAMTARRASEQLALDQAQGRHALALAAGRRWRDAWAAALAPLGIGPGTGTAEAEAILTLTDHLADLCRQRDGVQHRIAAMEADVATFSAEVGNLVGQAAPDLVGRPALEALAFLGSRLQAAREASQRRREMEQRMLRLRHASEEASAALAQAERTLDALCRLAACSDPEELPEAERRSGEKSRLATDLKDHENALLAAGDGQGLAALAAEADGAKADEIPGLKESISGRLSAIDEERSALMTERARHQAELDHMNGDSVAAAGAEHAEQVAANIREDAQHYMRLRLGQALLRQLMENYRKRHQGPLLERGGELFRRLTLEGFEGVDTGFDRTDTPILLARREDGRRLEIADLSEGTRDQLFLALRLAAVEQHLAAGRRLPFIADDLLIHFDDERAMAAIEVLAELSGRTQVIFFTHNRHMVDLARSRLPASRVNVITL